VRKALILYFTYVEQLDLSALYARYGTRGGAPYAPEVLLGLPLYGYATGVFSSRKIGPCRKNKS